MRTRRLDYAIDFKSYFLLKKGIGYHTALELAKLGAQIYIGARNLEAASDAISEMKNISDNQEIHCLFLDLENLYTVRNFCNRLFEKIDRIDVLINNAGQISPKLVYTADSFEQTFQVNYLSHFLITSTLLNLLKQSDAARIINVSSMAHCNSPEISESFMHKWITKPQTNSLLTSLQNDYNPFKMYAASKLMNILFTIKLNKMLSDTNLTVNCLHPGIVATGFSSSVRSSKFYNSIANTFFAVIFLEFMNT